MRRLRSPGQAGLLSVLSAMVFAACGGYQAGYYGACDEAAGLALGCDPGDDDPDPFSAWDACMKLAACGVILTQVDPDNPNPDTPDPIEACVDQIRGQGGVADVILACIDASACSELAETVDADDDPVDSQQTNIEGVIGWCGRLDPR